MTGCRSDGVARLVRPHGRGPSRSWTRADRRCRGRAPGRRGLRPPGAPRPGPPRPDALEIAFRRGEGGTPEEHDRAEQDERTGEEPSAAHLVPELKAQQLELGTPVCRTLDEVDRELRFWRDRAASAAAATGAHVAALATSPLPVEPLPTEADRYSR